MCAKLHLRQRQCSGGKASRLLLRRRLHAQQRCGSKSEGCTWTPQTGRLSCCQMSEPLVGESFVALIYGFGVCTCPSLLPLDPPLLTCPLATGVIIRLTWAAVRLHVSLLRCCLPMWHYAITGVFCEPASEGDKTFNKRVYVEQRLASSLFIRRSVIQLTV